jgi:hypothetical protein
MMAAVSRGDTARGAALTTLRDIHQLWGTRLPTGGEMGETENNHRPFWAMDVLNPPPPPDGGTPDAGICLMQNQSCANGEACCVGLVCQPNTAGTDYICGPIQ